MFHHVTRNGKTDRPMGAIGVMAFASTFAFSAWAGRPLATDDAGVLGPEECEIESYAGRVRNRNNPGIDTLWTQLGCGTGRNSQLAFGAGIERSGAEQTGVAELTGKTFLRELTDEQSGFTLAYALFGAREPGNSFRHEATELNAVFSAPVAGGLFHANLGGHYSHTSKHYRTVWGLAIECPGAIGPVDLMAEAIGDDRIAPWLQVAARWTVIPKHFYLDSSWGTQTDSVRARQITVGLKLAF